MYLQERNYFRCQYSIHSCKSFIYILRNFSNFSFSSLEDSLGLSMLEKKFSSCLFWLAFSSSSFFFLLFHFLLIPPKSSKSHSKGNPRVQIANSLKRRKEMFLKNRLRKTKSPKSQKKKKRKKFHS